MSDQQDDKDLQDALKTLEDRGIPKDAIDKFIKKNPPKKVGPHFTEIKEGLWQFSDSKDAIGFIQREPEGKWVCAMNDTHWGNNKIGSYSNLDRAKQAVMEHYNKYFK